MLTPFTEERVFSFAPSSRSLGQQHREAWPKGSSGPSVVKWGDGLL